MDKYELSHREKVLREIYSHEKFWFDMKSNLQIGKKIFLEVGYVFWVWMYLAKSRTNFVTKTNSIFVNKR